MDKDFTELMLEAEIAECVSHTDLYWKMLALDKKRVWSISKWRFPYLGSDEYWRRTVVIGPLVIALWVTSEGKLLQKKLQEKWDYMTKHTVL